MEWLAAPIVGLLGALAGALIRPIADDAWNLGIKKRWRRRGSRWQLTKGRDALWTLRFLGSREVVGWLRWKAWDANGSVIDSGESSVGMPVYARDGVVVGTLEGFSSFHVDWIADGPTHQRIEFRPGAEENVMYLFPYGKRSTLIE
ncbi:hypothetical protein ACFSBZ_01640 [Amnibacterium flavum]|uniref:Uncharacterized protein n=1 Tax=Amnibacterium flavum TaxID=2173173 RepID=A0A2V1HWX4_9MICO|nr:hypothetical protein [Amnibacterium flavum]PVZ94744.1 hypothetical protein DDQ50_13790 [Amnibacterium flavum]